MSKIVILTAMCLLALANGKIYLHESFDTDSAWVNEFGEMKLSSGDFFGDKEINQGYTTGQEARLYVTSRPIDASVSNEDKDFVVSLSVKHEQGLDCGGGSIILFQETDDAKRLDDNEYYLMFPNSFSLMCENPKKVHIIFNHKGEKLHWKKEPRYPDDKLTHVYTVVVRPDNTYEFYLDQEKKESGKLEEDWKFLPKEIDDPSDKKPADWVDDAQRDDPEDKKPDDWEIAHPWAEKPDEWDNDEDGEWEAPVILNPKYQGEWAPKRIPNPAYKGPWAPKQIPNPDYVPDNKLYLIQKPIVRVGLDVWRVKSASIFDNIIIGDNLEEVNDIVDKTWKATKDAEKSALDAKEAATKAETAKKEKDITEDL